MKVSKLNTTRVAFVILILAALALVALEHSVEGFVIIAISAILLIFLVRRHAASTVYACPRCGHQFKISSIKDFMSPHKGFEKWLQCPQCAAIEWCREV